MEEVEDDIDENASTDDDDTGRHDVVRSSDDT